VSNSVTLEVILEGKNLKVIQRDVDKVTDSVNKNTASRDKLTGAAKNYQKREKGVAQSTSNSTKAFAKQTSGINEGLVPAYATLAANIFAIGAVFRALQNSAALEQLGAGLEAVGAAAGSNLPYLASQLRDITGGAISVQEAMSSVALGISAGFSTDQLKGLTEVAKGASLALGRDMEDAMNRLVRGTAKLEPEILDELGIMIRLDDVTRDYAAAVNKVPEQLTRFERSQAFLNATIEQGQKKFQAIADSVDPNPYDQLAASFRSLTQSGLSMLNNVAVPLIKFLAASPTGLFAAVALFSTTL